MSKAPVQSPPPAEAPKKRGRPRKPVEEGFRLVPLECLTPNNYRKTFVEEEIQEMADSIKGVGIIEPLIVRPREGGSAEQRLFEIVCGEKRFRGASLADMESVPCVVRHLTDRQALEIQLIENGRRGDAPPLEESAAYHRLVEMGATHAEIADTLGVTVSKVRGVLSLARRPESLAKALAAGLVPRSTCELVCRIPTAEGREQLADEVLNDRHDGQPLTFMQVKEHIESRYQVELKGASFDRKSLKLYPEAGSCKDCPKRTGNLAKEDEAYKGSRADVCTDTACYMEKAKRQRELTEREAIDKGWKVLADDEARNHLSGEDLSRFGYQYLDLDRTIPDLGPSMHLWQMLSSENRSRSIRDLVSEMKDLPVVLMHTPRHRPIYAVRSAWLSDTLRGLGLVKPPEPLLKSKSVPAMPAPSDDPDEAKPRPKGPTYDELNAANNRRVDLVREIVSGWMAEEGVDDSPVGNFPTAMRPLFRHVAGVALNDDGQDLLIRFGVFTEQEADDRSNDLEAKLAEWSNTKNPSQLIGAMLAIAADPTLWSNSGVEPKEIHEFCEIDPGESKDKPEAKPCFRCDGTGQVCNACGESESVCQGDCQDEEKLAGHENCPDCAGTGSSSGGGEDSK